MGRGSMSNGVDEEETASSRGGAGLSMEGVDRTICLPGSHGKPAHDPSLEAEDANSQGSTRSADSTEVEPQRSREWVVYNHIAKYAKSDDALASLLTTQTMAVYWGLFAAACIYNGPFKWPVSCGLTLLCGLTRTRVFCLMHDMAHQSFFSSRIANDMGATLLGAMVYTPYTGWAKGHNYHHRYSNNTDRKQTAQTAPLTAEQYRAMPVWSRVAYNAIYGHWTLLTTTPWLYFVVGQRFMSSWYENVIILAYWGSIYAYGTTRVAAVDMASAAIGASLGVFLFHIQHTFEGAYKASGDDYSRFDNGMQGSSFLVVPEPFKFFTASIEYHNVHHLNTRVPLYRLRACFEEGGAIFDGVPTFTMWEALQRLPYSLRHDDSREFSSCYDEALK